LDYGGSSHARTYRRRWRRSKSRIHPPPRMAQRTRRPSCTPSPSTRLLPVQFLIVFGQTFYIEASMNGMFGCAEGDNIQPPNMHRYFTLHTADIVIPYMPAWHLFWDYWVITDCARELGGWEERQALTVATEIVNTFRRGDRSSIDACRKVAQKFLGKHVDSHKVRPSLPPFSPRARGVQ
jgi:hypothetical protein